MLILFQPLTLGAALIAKSLVRFLKFCLRPLRWSEAGLELYLEPRFGGTLETDDLTPDHFYYIVWLDMANETRRGLATWQSSGAFIVHSDHFQAFDEHAHLPIVSPSRVNVVRSLTSNRTIAINSLELGLERPRQGDN